MEGMPTPKRRAREHFPDPILPPEPVVTSVPLEPVQRPHVPETSRTPISQQPDPAPKQHHPGTLPPVRQFSPPPPPRIGRGIAFGLGAVTLGVFAAAAAAIAAISYGAWWGVGKLFDAVGSSSKTKPAAKAEKKKGDHGHAHHGGGGHHH